MIGFKEETAIKLCELEQGTIKRLRKIRGTPVSCYDHVFSKKKLICKGLFSLSGTVTYDFPGDAVDVIFFPLFIALHNHTLCETDFVCQ